MLGHQPQAKPWLHIRASSPCNVSQAAAQPQSMSCPRGDKASPEELRWGPLPFLGAALLPLPPCAALEGSADTEGTPQKPGVRADTKCTRKRPTRAQMTSVCVCVCANRGCRSTRRHRARCR